MFVDVEFVFWSVFEMVVNWIEVKKFSVIVEKGKGDEKGCDFLVSDELLRDFVKKFGYNEDIIIIGLSKFGFLVDINLLLLEFVKV